MIDNVMNGQPRAVFPTGLSANVLLIYLFGSYWSYLVSYFIQHLLAFGGMYLLLRKHFLSGEKHRFICVGVSLCFSLVPFYIELGVFGLPLLLFCFLNILKNHWCWTDFLFIILFPLFSSMVWTGVSALAALGLMLFFDIIRQKKMNVGFLVAIALLAVSYGLVNIQMLSLSFFNKEFISHRTEYDIFILHEMSFLKGALDTIYPMLLSHYHAGTLVTFPIIAAAAMAFYYCGKDKVSVWLMISIAAACLAYGFYVYAAYALGDIFPILITFKANRFIILLPLLFFLLFAVSLKRISEGGVNKSAVAIILCCQLAIGFFSNDEWLHNMRNLFGFKIKPGYREFFAKNLFKKIDDYIAQPKQSYRVASLGISTGATQHNGFYTLDGLQAIYSLEHKKQFREVITPELEKNNEVKNYYDSWGNRCHVFSSELGIADRNFIIGKNRHLILNDFEINAGAFKKMGGKYLFSAVEIKEPEKTGLKLLKVFEDDEGWWRVYLYEAI